MSIVNTYRTMQKLITIVCFRNIHFVLYKTNEIGNHISRGYATV